MSSLDHLLIQFLDSPLNLVYLAVVLVMLGLAFIFRHEVTYLTRFVIKSMGRNMLRTVLTSIATMVLVVVVTFVWTILSFLGQVTGEKAKEQKAIITEKWQIPSQMPYSYYTGKLAEGAYNKEGDYRVDSSRDAMAWSFYAGTLDPTKSTRENIIFFFCMEPSKLMDAGFLTRKEKAELDKLAADRGNLPPAKTNRLAELESMERDQKELKDLTDKAIATAERAINSGDMSHLVDDDVNKGLLRLLEKPGAYTSMMDGIDESTPQERVYLYLGCKLLERNPRYTIVGLDRMKAMNKQVGDKITVTGTNYKGIDLEFHIIGVFPDGRYNQSSIMNFNYLQNSLDKYKVDNKGTEHSLAQKTLNLAWLRVPDSKSFQTVAKQIDESTAFKDPAIKCETASSGVAAFLESYRDLLWGMQWLLVPALLATMSLVIANAISISVRERRTEMAVLKVLGFSPNQVMILILGEAIFIGAGSGFISAAMTFLMVNSGGGIKFPIAFFPAFKVPAQAMLWGPCIGGLTALVGSIIPSWSARTVKVSEVFSKVS